MVYIYRNTPSLISKQNIAALPLLIGITVILSLSDCVGYSKIANAIEENASALQTGDLTLLHTIPADKLAVAKDTSKGALYYAGLIWYYNNDEHKAMISLKRSARTGISPWNQEAARLVSYLMIRNALYNQIPPFLESIYSKKYLVQDPELFYYYSLALWLTRDFKTLRNLTAGTAIPTWNKTLRSRINIEQANFAFNIWKLFVAIYNGTITGSASDTAIIRIITQYTTENIMGDFIILMERLRSIHLFSDEVYDLVRAKTAVLEEDKNQALALYLALPSRYFIFPEMQNDLLSIVGTNHTALKKAQQLLKTVNTNKSNAFQRMLYNFTLGDLYFKLDNKKESFAYYKKGLETSVVLLQDSKYQVYIQRSIWRYLYVHIFVSPTTFIRTFKRIIIASNNPAYFSNVLEEYMSAMLRSGKINTLIQDITALESQYDNPEIQLELTRWKSAISRINNQYTPDIIASIPFDTLATYYSDYPFDYLIYYKGDATTAKTMFIKDWGNKQPVVFTDPFAEDIMIGGYIKYGLYQYAYDVAQENIATISPQHIRTLSQALYNIDENKKAYVLMRNAATQSHHMPNTIEDMYLLYPQLYINIIDTITKNPLEKALLLGVMREESAFDPVARSSANAIGLIQLLPATAKDIASRIGYKHNYSLVDPTDSLTLGYHYIRYLIRVIKTPTKALIAYNGGLGNLWKWEDIYNDNDLIVFAESIPFAETRNYTRKVVSSAMIYALLYYNISPHTFLQYLTSIYTKHMELK